MLRVDNIITGVFSEHHFSMSVREAQKLAKVFKARIKPVHVIETLGMNPFYPKEKSQAKAQALAKFTEDVERLYNKHGASHVDEPEVHMGRIHNEICEVAKKYSNSLIVMGRHKEGVMHRFLTTESEKVIAQGQSPVWVHPHRNISRLPQKIVCGLDFSTNCFRAAQSAVMVAKACSAELIFVHVVPESSGYVEMEGQLNIYYPMEDQEREVMHESVNETLKSMLNQLEFENVKYTEKILYGGAADGVISIARDSDADLIVIGKSSHGMFERLFMGSTLRWVLNEFDRDVLIIP